MGKRLQLWNSNELIKVKIDKNKYFRKSDVKKKFSKAYRKTGSEGGKRGPCRSDKCEENSKSNIAVGR